MKHFPEHTLLTHTFARLIYGLCSAAAAAATVDGPGESWLIRWFALACAAAAAAALEVIKAAPPPPPPPPPSSSTRKLLEVRCVRRTHHRPTSASQQSALQLFL